MGIVGLFTMVETRRRGKGRQTNPLISNCLSTSKERHSRRSEGISRDVARA